MNLQRTFHMYTSRLRHVQIVSWTWPHMVLKFQVWNVFGWSRYQQKEDGKNASMRCYCCKSFLILFRLIPCGDIYCRPHTYCRRRQFMPVHLAHIVAQKLFCRRRQCMPVSLKFDTSRWPQNMPSTLKQIVAENSTEFQIKYQDTVNVNLLCLLW